MTYFHYLVIAQLRVMMLSDALVKLLSFMWLMDGHMEDVAYASREGHQHHGKDHNIEVVTKGHDASLDFRPSHIIKAPRA